MQISSKSDTEQAINEPESNTCSTLHVTSEAEERAKKEAEEQAQQQEEMEPQEVQTQSEQPEPEDDKLEGETPESAEVSRPPDGNRGETEHEAQPGSPTHKIPPLQNGTYLCLCTTVVMSCF